MRIAIAVLATAFLVAACGRNASGPVLVEVRPSGAAPVVAEADPGL